MNRADAKQLVKEYTETLLETGWHSKETVKKMKELAGESLPNIEYFLGAQELAWMIYKKEVATLFG